MQTVKISHVWPDQKRKCKQSKKSDQEGKEVKTEEKLKKQKDP